MTEKMVLTKREQKALTEYQHFVLQKFPQQIERLILFGSRARGDATAESDIDLLVVLHKKVKPGQDGFYPIGLTDPVWRGIVGATFDFLLEYGVDISPTVMSRTEYAGRSPLLNHIEQDGIELWTRPN